MVVQIADTSYGSPRCATELPNCWDRGSGCKSILGVAWRSNRAYIMLAG